MGIGAAGAAAIAAGASAAGGIASSVISGQAAKGAAKAQTQAQMQAAVIQQQQADQARNDLAPYREAGQQNLDTFGNFYKTAADQYGTVFGQAGEHIPSNTPQVPNPMTQAELEATPGYQFTKQQGMRSVANSNAAKGLGISGNALQATGSYVTGLANKTYLDQINAQDKRFGWQQKVFEDQNEIYKAYLTQANLKGNQLDSLYKMQLGPVEQGRLAASKSGELGQQSAQAIGGAFGQIGNAQAYGITGQANALSSGINSLANAPATYLGVKNEIDTQAALRNRLAPEPTELTGTWTV